MTGIGIGIGLGLTLTPPVSGLTAPEGFGFVVDGDGAYVVDSDGAYVIAEIE